MMTIPKPIARPIATFLAFCMIYGPLAQMAVANNRVEDTGGGVNCTPRGHHTHIMTGSRFFEENDIILPTSGISMEFTRRYDSLETEYKTGPLGVGWTHTLDWRIYESVERVEEITPPGGLEDPVQMTVKLGDDLSVEHGSTNTLKLVPVFFAGAVTPPRLYNFEPSELRDMYIVSGLNKSYMDISGSFTLDLPNLGDRPDWVVSSVVDVGDNPLPIIGINFSPGEYSVGDPVPGREDGMTFGGIERKTYAYLYLRTESPHRIKFELHDGIYTSEKSAWRIRVENDQYILEMPGGIEKVFNTSGLMTEIHDAWGNHIALSYEEVQGEMRLVEAEHSNGQTMEFQYNQDSRLSRVDVSNDFYLTFTYDANGQLASASRHISGVTTISSFEYTDGFMTQRTLPNGLVIHHDYVLDGTGKRTFQGSDYVAGAENMLPYQVAYIDEYTRRLTYPVSNRNEVVTYEMGYSAKDRQLEVELGPGSNLTDARTRGRRTSYTTDTLTTEVFFDDNIGESYSYFRQYDTNRNVTQLEVAYVDANNTATNRALIHQSQYDPVYSLPTRITDAAGNKVETAYTNARPTVVSAFYSDSGSYDTHFSYTTNGLLSAIQNANSNVTQFAYDSRGFLASVTPPVGPSARSVCNALGFLTESEILPEGSTNGTGRVTTYTRNAEGRLDAVHFADGLSVTNQYSATEKLLRTTDRAGRHTDFDYVLGSDFSRHNPAFAAPDLKSVTSYLDAPGGTSQPVRITYDYDEQLWSLRITEPRGRYVESYQLDIQGRVTSVTNINNQVMTIQYGLGDLFGGHGDFVKQVIRFDGSTVSSAYDNVGRRVSAVISDGFSSVTNSTSYTTNSLVSGVSDGAMSFAYAYDRLNRMTNAVQSGTGVLPVQTRYAYDPVGNPTNVILSIDSGAAVFERDYEYDAANRLTGFTNHSSTHQSSTAFAISYNPTNGATHSVTNVDTGIGVEYAYDVMDRRTEINWTFDATNNLRSFTMGYEPRSGMIQYVIEPGGIYRTYGYDSLDRLVSEHQYDSTTNLIYSASYAYDLAGNRTQSVVNAGSGAVTNVYTLGTGDRLASWGTNAENTVTYDTAGNVTQIALGGRPALDLTWDLQYRLTAAKTNGVTVESYQYDASGRRISTTSGTNTTFHVYDGMHVIADTDADGNVLKSYVWGPGIDNLLSMTVYGETATNTYQAITDHIGTVRELVDESGNTVERYEYDAWGNVLAVHDSNGDPLTSELGLPISGIGNRFLFQGREYSWAIHAANDGAGLYNFRARWYDPLTGRWLSNDPIGISGGLNQYVAFGNNPVTFVDPWGLSQNLAADHQSLANRTGFPSADRAARVALQTIFPASVQSGREFAGYIYRGSDGKYYFTEATEGLSGKAKLEPYFGEGVIVAYYHTHPPKPGQDRFSTRSSNGIYNSSDDATLEDQRRSEPEIGCMYVTNDGLNIFRRTLEQAVNGLREPYSHYIVP